MKTRKGGGNYGINKKELTNAIQRMSNTNGFQKQLNTMKAKINSMNGNLNRVGIPNESVITNNRNQQNFGLQQASVTQNQLRKNANQLFSPNVPIGRQIPNNRDIHAAINQGNLVDAATMLNGQPNNLSEANQVYTYEPNASQQIPLPPNEGNNQLTNYTYERNANGNPISLITNNNKRRFNASQQIPPNEGNNQVTNNGNGSLFNASELNTNVNRAESPRSLNTIPEENENLIGGDCGCGLKFKGGKRTMKNRRNKKRVTRKR